MDEFVLFQAKAASGPGLVSKDSIEESMSALLFIHFRLASTESFEEMLKQ